MEQNSVKRGSTTVALGGFGGVENEEAAFGGVLDDVGDEGLVVEVTKVMAGDPLKGLKERCSILDNFGDFIRWDADVEVLAAVKGRLGSGAEDSGGAEIVDEAAETADNRMEQ